MLVNFKKTAIFGLIILAVSLASFTSYQGSKSTLTDFTADTPISDIFEKLGKIKLNQVNPKIEGVSAQIGKSIIYDGYSTQKDGTGKTSMQSIYFKCTACHNVEREFKDLTDINAADKLNYAIEKDLPFLQGSTFHGIVNRTNFYNGDYQKKYGSVAGIRNSYNDIRSAIQFCATQCAQGRELEDWELESILAFFWTKELKVKDLNMATEKQAIVKKALKEQTNAVEASHAIEEHYLKTSPAHFAEKDIEYKELTATDKSDKARFASGKEVYQRGCEHCHANQRYSFFSLDDNTLDFKFLLSKAQKGGFQSIFKITRHGTYSLNGKKAYMPQYPIEKMSDKQLMDLRIYIENMAEGSDLLK